MWRILISGRQKRPTCIPCVPFDIGKDGASAENNSGSIKVQSPTPSVDADGTVYALAGFNEPNKGQGGSAFYAVSGGASGGSQLWYTNTGVNTSFRFL